MVAAQDGGAEAKKAILDKAGRELKTAGFYSEMSDALAHIMLTKYGAPSIDDQATVEKVLGKKVQWVGAHPKGKYPDHPGWYIRKLGGEGGKEHMKILLGKPKVSESRGR